MISANFQDVHEKPAMTISAASKTDSKIDLSIESSRGDQAFLDNSNVATHCKGKHNDGFSDSSIVKRKEITNRDNHKKILQRTEEVKAELSEVIRELFKADRMDILNRLNIAVLSALENAVNEMFENLADEMLENDEEEVMRRTPRKITMQTTGAGPKPPCTQVQCNAQFPKIDNINREEKEEKEIYRYR
ncbi:hypothetical protein NECAME_07993 [Necator americanus]|uniref:Uncharacterized protein n=1 Tax=Necator americanus TaxID=51031 RepID=W2TMQ1_NECAM|nr:hypothetical protein NECAME_07993 [Necator americanus]ETN82416.1 hypothetical protein NECAME_07993 [Necator americanus]